MTGLTLDEARRSVGAGVVFRGGASAEDEAGVITSVNAAYVFVRYAGDQHSKATPADRLSLLTTTVPCDECGTPTTDPETCDHGREQCPECRESLGFGCKACAREAGDR